MFRIAICEDDQECLEILQDIIKGITKSFMGYQNLMVDSYISAKDLSCRVADGYCYDLIVLEWDMHGCCGAEIGKSIRETDPDCLIVVVSASDEDILKAFKLTIFRYIIKNRLREEFPEALMSAYDKIVSKEVSIRIKTVEGNYHLVRMKNIVLIESHKDGVTVMLKQSESVHTKRAFFREHVTDFMNYGFVMSYKGVLINRNEILSVHHNQIVMSNGAQVPLSRKYRSSILNVFK